jgi:hypothetical protein
MQDIIVMELIQQQKLSVLKATIVQWVLSIQTNTLALLEHMVLLLVLQLHLVALNAMMDITASFMDKLLSQPKFCNDTMRIILMDNLYQILIYVLKPCIAQKEHN